MTPWEYKIATSIEDIHTAGALDKLGAEGWELVGFDGRGIAFFKRPIAIPLPAPAPAKPVATAVAVKPVAPIKSEAPAKK